MDLILVGALAGVLGTLAMDLLNNLIARTGILLKIEVEMIGRMAVGWTHGRFCYGNPEELKQAQYEMIYGYVIHYLFGVGLAVLYLLGWAILVGGPASPIWAVVYGVATTAASYFFVYPSMGLGAFGKRSPERIRAILSPIANHLFYGVGLAVGVALV